MKRQFEEHIQNLIFNEDNFIYKTNLELLRLYYNFLYSKFEDEELCSLYLEQFDSISKITSSNIESNFSDLVIEYMSESFNTSDLDELECSGIYFIFNDIDNLIYIGKTNNLSTRPLQSFINKMPYGASYIKIIKFTHIDSVEAILIDYYLPMYNNKKETLPSIKNRTYTKMVELCKRELTKSLRIYPIEDESVIVERQSKVDRLNELLEKRRNNEKIS
jgi:hypothetical protein